MIKQNATWEFPAEFVSEYVAMKHDEWDDYHSQVTDWERDRNLNDR